VLKNVSAAIAGIAGPGDCAARVGGDEFVVLIEDFVDRSELTEIAERLTSSVARATVSGNLTGEMRVSCGVAVFPDDGLSAHDVLREADIGMFRSKRRNRVAGHSRTA
jgi:diguanylate cyclase (GGDEF)-like protein